MSIDIVITHGYTIGSKEEPMQTVKTAISIDKALFDRAEALARTLQVSRSRVFVLALEESLLKRLSFAL